MITGLGVCPAGICPFITLGLETPGAAVCVCCTGADTDIGSLDPSTTYYIEEDNTKLQTTFSDYIIYETSPIRLMAINAAGMMYFCSPKPRNKHLSTRFHHQSMGFWLNV